MDALLQELDTVPDLVTYLAKKEAYLSQRGIVFSAPGEEDLLARYMLTLEGEEHAFPKVPEGMNFVGLPEGEWADYVGSPQRAAKRKADLVSYVWDAVIEDQSKSSVRALRARGLGLRQKQLTTNASCGR